MHSSDARTWFYFYRYEEERPGHHVKLYQYCSADINDIVQRHLRVRFLPLSQWPPRLIPISTTVRKTTRVQPTSPVAPIRRSTISATRTMMMEMMMTTFHPGTSVGVMASSNHHQTCTSQGYGSMFSRCYQLTPSHRWITAIVALQYRKRPPYRCMASVLRMLGQVFLYLTIACQTSGIPLNAVG